jgi:hypothetical protein
MVDGWQMTPFVQTNHRGRQHPISLFRYAVSSSQLADYRSGQEAETMASYS